MRKKEREITDRREIEAVLKAARIMRLAINDPDGPPYIVPVNFGYRDGAIFFHSSYDGKKMELIAEDPLVSFEAEADVSIIPPADRTSACEWGVAYRSVIGRGRARLLTDPDEKRAGLLTLMTGVAPDVNPSEFTINDEILTITAVVKIEVEELTGKKNPS
jgi:nitroimidazol reductase NimA-like FMN-containing flavoprotein (pyridoxamine 5'-phosphate oxidase superfamily)